MDLNHRNLKSNSLRERLQISPGRLDSINQVLTSPNIQVVNDFLEIVKKYGTPEEINRKAKHAGQVSRLLKQVGQIRPDYLADLLWLKDQAESGAFISMAEYRRAVLGDQRNEKPFADEFAVTLEISACQYFPWLMAIAKRAIAQQMLVPGRFIQVRRMKEQEIDTVNHTAQVLTQQGLALIAAHKLHPCKREPVVAGRMG